MATKAAFLDRDGTLNDERGLDYVHRLQDFHWLPGAREAIRKLNSAGYLVVVVTNQAGVARGLYTGEDVDVLHSAVQSDLNEAGALVDAFYYSPYHVEGTVPEFALWHEDRKPGTGMFERAIRDFDIDPLQSFMIGDKASDLIPAKALDMRTALVLTGHGEDHASTLSADVVVDDIAIAADWILSGDAQRRAY